MGIDADFIRWLNILIAIVNIALLLRKAKKYWPEYHTRTKDFWWVMLCWCIVVVFDSLEILLKWDTEIRVLFTTFALALTLKVLLRTNEVKSPTFTNEL